MKILGQNIIRKGLSYIVTLIEIVKQDYTSYASTLCVCQVDPTRYCCAAIFVIIAVRYYWLFVKCCTAYNFHNFVLPQGAFCCLLSYCISVSCFKCTIRFLVYNLRIKGIVLGFIIIIKWFFSWNEAQLRWPITLQFYHYSTFDFFLKGYLCISSLSLASHILF